MFPKSHTPKGLTTCGPNDNAAAGETGLGSPWVTVKEPLESSSVFTSESELELLNCQLVLKLLFVQ